MKEVTLEILHDFALLVFSLFYPFSKYYKLQIDFIFIDPSLLSGLLIHQESHLALTEVTPVKL